MPDFVPQMRNNENENIDQWLPFLPTPSTDSIFVPIYFMEVFFFFFSDLTHQITLLTLCFFLVGILVPALKYKKFFREVK